MEAIPSPDHNEGAPRKVVALGEDFPSSFEVSEHQHRRSQFLYASRGVMVVSTPDGAWVAPSERAVWIPGGIPHAVRMVGTVQTRTVLIEPEACPGRGETCQVVGVSPLLRQLLFAASEIPVEYDQAGRDGLVMDLLVAEVNRAPLIPLAVPFPAHAGLARLCQAFIGHPDIGATTEDWAERLIMNRRSFTRLFRRETGMSFGEWKQQACVSIALPRLAAGEAVTVVAYDLGYEGPGNFSTMFRRLLGVSPSHYRFV